MAIMPSGLGQNQFDTLVKKFTAQGMSAGQARAKARAATQPVLSPPPGVIQQPPKQ